MTTKPPTFCACDYGVPCQPAADALRAERDALRAAAADMLGFLRRPEIRRACTVNFVLDLERLDLLDRLKDLTNA